MSGIFNFSPFSTSVGTFSDSILDSSESTPEVDPLLHRQALKSHAFDADTSSSISSETSSFIPEYFDSESSFINPFAAEGGKSKRLKKADTEEQEKTLADFSQLSEPDTILSEPIVGRLPLYERTEESLECSFTPSLKGRVSIEQPVQRSSSPEHLEEKDLSDENTADAVPADFKLNPKLSEIFLKVSQAPRGKHGLASKKVSTLKLKVKGAENQKMKKVFEQELQKIQNEFPGHLRFIYCEAIGVAYPFSDDTTRNFNGLTRLLEHIPVPAPEPTPDEPEVTLNPDLSKIFVQLTQKPETISPIDSTKVSKLTRPEKTKSNQRMKPIFEQELRKLQNEFPGFGRYVYCNALSIAYPYSNGERPGFSVLIDLLARVPIPALAPTKQTEAEIEKEKELCKDVAQQLQALKVKYDHVYHKSTSLYIQALGMAFPHSEKPRKSHEIYALLNKAKSVEIVSVLPSVDKHFLELAQSSPDAALLTTSAASTETNQDEGLNPDILTHLETIKNRKIGNMISFEKALKTTKHTLSRHDASIANKKMLPTFLSQLEKLQEKEPDLTLDEKCMALAMAYPYSDGSIRTLRGLKMMFEKGKSSGTSSKKGEKRKVED